MHCPPGTEHIFVGAGDGPCVIFMAGARTEPRDTVYVDSDLARRHGAGAERETSASSEAYAPFGRWRARAARELGRAALGAAPAPMSFRARRRHMR